MSTITANKINLWPIISNVLLIAWAIFIFTNFMSNRTLKTKMKESQAKETILTQQIELNNFKIDSLKVEIVKRDSIIKVTTKNVFTLEQFKSRYEKDYNRIDVMSIDDNIKLFATETSN